VGILTDEQADEVVEFQESEERIRDGFIFDRYTDMSGYSRIQMSLEHVFTIAKRRRKEYRGKPVKSAFFCRALDHIEHSQDVPGVDGRFADRGAGFS
jgi:hypothetical protein